MYRSIALRKVKSLGPSKRFNVLVPGQISWTAKPLIQPTETETLDSDSDEIATTSVVFEPLVLWTDPNDDTNKVEVILPQHSSANI